MIAVIERAAGGPPHVARWIGQKSLLSVIAISYCRVEFDAGKGVSQLPDDVLICPACEAAMKKEPYRKR